jgi:hypothetical protein
MKTKNKYRRQLLDELKHNYRVFLMYLMSIKITKEKNYNDFIFLYRNIAIYLYNTWHYGIRKILLEQTTWQLWRKPFGHPARIASNTIFN